LLTGGEPKYPKWFNHSSDTRKWQTLDNHFANSADNKKTVETELQFFWQQKSGSPHGLISSPVVFLEYELLTRYFQESHAEVGCRVRELSDIVLQGGIIVDDVQPNLQNIDKQLLKGSTGLFKAIAHKMPRLRTKMGFVKFGTGQVENARCRKGTKCTDTVFEQAVNLHTAIRITEWKNKRPELKQ